MSKTLNETCIFFRRVALVEEAYIVLVAFERANAELSETQLEILFNFLLSFDVGPRSDVVQDWAPISYHIDCHIWESIWIVMKRLQKAGSIPVFLSRSNVGQILQDKLLLTLQSGNYGFAPILFDCASMLLPLLVSTSQNEVIEELWEASWNLYNSMDLKCNPSNTSGSFFSLLFHPSTFQLKPLFRVPEKVLQEILRATKVNNQHLCYGATFFVAALLQAPTTASMYTSTLVEICLVHEEKQLYIESEVRGEFDLAAVLNCDKLQKPDQLSGLVEYLLHHNSTRFVGLVFLEKIKEKHVNMPEATQLFDAMLRHIFITLGDKKMLDAVNCSTGSPGYYRTAYLWQVLCILSPTLCHLGRDTLKQIICGGDRIWKLLYRTTTPEIRHMIEIFLVSFLTQNPVFIKELLFPHLLSKNRPTMAISLVQIYAWCVVNCSKDQVCHYLGAKEALNVISPQLTSSFGVVRVCAQMCFMRLMEKLDLGQVESSAALDPKLEIFRYMQRLGDLGILLHSQPHLFHQYNPLSVCTLNGLMRAIKAEATQDYESEMRRSAFIPGPVSVETAAVIGNFLSNMHVYYEDNAKAKRIAETEAASAEDRIPAAAAAAGTIAEVTDEGGAAGAAPSFYQKKVVVMQAPASSIDTSAGTPATLKEPCTPKRQTLVVVASLITDPVVLGGLSRMCEIFGVEKLVMGNNKILDDPTFQVLSVTAYKWVPMEVVPPDSLPSFLVGLRRASYNVVSLDRRRTSQPLQYYQFPAKTVIVLSPTRQGLPTTLIPCIDDFVSFPHSGLSPSAVPHINAAMAVWEVTRQRLVKNA